MTKDGKPFPSGAMVEKRAYHSGDKHPVGTVGRISRYIGEVVNPVTMRKVHGYEVQWAGEENVTTIYDDGRLAMLRTMD